ncbi:hypothetical protein BKA83DRAFT_4178706, partial [Pisolithus microcarpus]
VHIRIANEVTTETQLRSVVDATSDLLGVSEFWVCPDYRESVGANAITAPTSFHTSLQNFNENYLRDSLSGKIDVPAVRVLRLGTFGKFREWKIRTSGGAAVGQMNVPVVVCDEGCRTWLEGRVVCDV